MLRELVKQKAKQSVTFKLFQQDVTSIAVINNKVDYVSA